MSEQPKPLPVALPESLAEARVRYRCFGGNPPHAPYRYGWTLRVDRYTTEEERAFLRGAGFRFSGGKWKLPEADRSAS